MDMHFGRNFVPKRPSVFVNLYNNEWNTNFPEWQDGSWLSRVRLWLVRDPGLGGSQIVPSWEARLPLLRTAQGDNFRSEPKAWAFRVPLCWSLPSVKIRTGRACFCECGSNQAGAANAKSGFRGG